MFHSVSSSLLTYLKTLIEFFNLRVRKFHFSKYKEFLCGWIFFRGEGGLGLRKCVKQPLKPLLIYLARGQNKNHTTSKLELFVTIINGWKSLDNVTNRTPLLMFHGSQIHRSLIKSFCMKNSNLQLYCIDCIEIEDFLKLANNS